MGIGGTVVLGRGSWGGSGTPLALLSCAAVCRSGGEVGVRERLGREPPVEEYLDRLPEEVAERRLGDEVVPMEAKLAKALEVFSLANDANERRLLLLVRLTEPVWWW